MGITIYYRGQLASFGELEPCIEELTGIANTMKWTYREYNNEEAEVSDSLTLKGICFKLHPKSEHFCVCFDADGILRHPLSVQFGNLKNPITQKDMHVFVKTHFAPFYVHVSVVKLLRYLKKRYIPDLDVHDEAGYWETDDLPALKEFWGKVENNEAPEYSPDTMLFLLEEILNKI